MLKKFLGIFKRDKSNCSYQELVWQDKVVKIVVIIVRAILYLASIVCILLLGINMPIFSNEYIGSFRKLADLCFIIICVVILEIVVLIVNKIFNLKDIKKQLQIREMEILYLYLQTGLIKVSISQGRTKIYPSNSSNEAKEVMNIMKEILPDFDYEDDETNW